MSSLVIFPLLMRLWECFCHSHLLVSTNLFYALVLCWNSLPFLPGPLFLSMTPSPSLPPDGNMFIHYWYSDWAHFPPPCRPTFLQPALLHQSPHETHTHTNVQVCVWDKSCDNLECLLRGLCACARARVCSSQWDRNRETKWESTGSKSRVPIFRSI